MRRSYMPKSRRNHWSQKMSVFYVLFSALMVLIPVVDYLRGPGARVLNAYEIVRRTLFEPFGVKMPVLSNDYVMLQSTMGDFAIIWAWILFIFWASLLAGIGYAMIKAWGDKTE